LIKKTFVKSVFARGNTYIFFIMTIFNSTNWNCSS